jgi:hypothetical protein
MADETTAVSAGKPRSNVFTVLLLLTMLMYIGGIVLMIMEMQDVKNFRYQLFGKATYENPNPGP